MGYNLPPGVTDWDIDEAAGEHDPQYEVCDVCGGDIIDDECYECGIYANMSNVVKCGMCGSRGLTMVYDTRGYRLQCECGVATPYRENRADCLRDWGLLI